jgi:hypothetical protein
MRLTRTWRAGGALAATLILTATGAAPMAGAMPIDGYEPPDEVVVPAPSPTPKPSTPAVYCLTVCSNAFAVSIGGTTTSKVALSWSGASGYTGYDVERRRTGSGATFSVLARLAQDARDYRDTELTDNTSYDYRVTATGPNGSASSSVTIGKTLPAPTVLSVDHLTTRSADLHWNATNAATGYAVERRESVVGGSFATVVTLDATARDFTDSGLAYGKRYDYRVRALGISGLAPSNEVAATIIPAQVERVQLFTDWSEQFRFRGTGATYGPAGARIRSVRNVTLGDDYAPLSVIDIEHRTSERVIKSDSILGYNAVTDAFNGQLAKGDWSFRVLGSATFLWACVGTNWASSCNNAAVFVGLEVTWA